MPAKIGCRWHPRRLMADKEIYATTDLRPLLAERGIVLSREQVYRLATLAALCDILGCEPGQLIEPVAAARTGSQPAALSGPPPRPVRARVAGVRAR